MINANRDTSDEVLRRLKEGSEERFRAELINSIRMLLDNFQMTWDDLALQLLWVWPCPDHPHEIYSTHLPGVGIQKYVGSKNLTIKELNEIAHVFSTEPYLIFRPRKPYTST